MINILKKLFPLNAKGSVGVIATLVLLFSITEQSYASFIRGIGSDGSNSSNLNTGSDDKPRDSKGVVGGKGGKQASRGPEAPASQESDPAVENESNAEDKAPASNSDTAAPTNAPVTDTAMQTGDKGREGINGESGGDGADSFALNQVQGSSSGHVSLTQYALGGDGGEGSQDGGHGGHSTSLLLVNDIHSQHLDAQVAAFGGSGGIGQSNGGNGGDSTAILAASGKSDVSANTASFGGTGNVGGHAESMVSAESLQGSAHASAFAQAGSGHIGGGAHAEAQAISQEGVDAQSTAVSQGQQAHSSAQSSSLGHVYSEAQASGGLTNSGEGSALAESSANGTSGSVNASAYLGQHGSPLSASAFSQADVDGKAQVKAGLLAGGASTPSFGDGQGLQSIALVKLNPNLISASVTQINPPAGAEHGDTALASGVLGGNHGEGGLTHTSTSSVHFVFSAEGVSGKLLHLDFMPDSEQMGGFEQLTFTLSAYDDASSNVESWSFIDSYQAMDFFNGKREFFKMPTDLNDREFALDLELSLVTQAAQQGFSTAFSLSFVPEPGSLSLLVIGLNGWAFAGWRKKQKRP